MAKAPITDRRVLGVRSFPSTSRTCRTDPLERTVGLLTMGIHGGAAAGRCSTGSPGFLPTRQTEQTAYA